MHTEDPRLARLYDYTKFHIGIYILAAGAMVTIAGSEEMHGFIDDLIEHPILLLLAVAAMGVAGLAGGIIASTCASADTFDEVWLDRIGPWNLKVLPGRHWAALEHLAFWASSLLFIAAVLLPE